MIKLTEVKKIISGRSAVTRRSDNLSESYQNIVKLLAKQNEDLIAHNVSNLSGEKKVSQLIKCGFAEESAGGKLIPTQKALDYINGKVAYPIEAILEEQNHQ